MTGIGNSTAMTTQYDQLDDNPSRNNSILTNTTDIKKSSDDKQITLIWLESNETKLDNTRVFTINKYDFLKTFDELYESSNNNGKTIGTIE